MFLDFLKRVFVEQTGIMRAGSSIAEACGYVVEK